MSDRSESEEEPLEIEFTADERSRSSSITESTASRENDPPYFEIPISDDDLKIFRKTAYHVVEDDNIEEDMVREEVEIFASKLPDEGWRALKHHFDAFFSLAKINTKIKNDELWLLATRKLLDCYYILYQGSLRKALKRAVRSQGRLSEELVLEIAHVANNVLMLVYLLNRLSLHLENWYMSRLLGLEKKKGGRKLDLDENMEKWTQLRVKIVECFTQLCEISITDNSGNERVGALKFLWRPPEVDKRMITTIIETTFKFLENPTNKAVASLPWLRQIFTLIRSICIRYDYFSRMAVALVEKTVNLDYLREASTQKYPFIQAILAVAHDGDMDLLLSHMVHHLGDMLHSDFNSTSTKPYALLMTTMAELAPDIMIKQLSAILPYLQSDIPQFRSTVLQCFSHLLCSNKLSEGVCAQFSRVFNVRNRMLEYCRDHLKDENANVRSKTLQVWVTLAENKRIPTEQLQKALVSSIGDRLMDKSSTCRKSAFRFLMEFIESNPYGHDFDHDLHVKKLNDLNATRRKLKTKDPTDQTTAIAFSEFEEVRAQFETQLRDSLQQHRNGLDEDLGDELDPSVVLWAIGTQIVSYPIASARTVAALVMKGQFGKIDPNGELDHIVESCLDLCLKMYCSSKKRNRSMDNEAQLAFEDLIMDHKDEMARIGKEITQLIDKIVVAKEISECIPKAMRAVLLGDLPEMAEGMKFIVKCKHFNVSGADQAVRQTFSLIWRNNEDVRKEVLGTAETLFVSANTNPDIRVKSTVENLFTVLSGMKEEERACVEEVISKMAITELPEGTAKCVWKLADKNNPEKQKIALQLIGIFVKSDKDLRKYLRQMQATVKDRQLPSKIRVEALSAIASMADISKHSTEAGWAFRLPANDSLFTVIETFVIEEFMRAPNRGDGSVWFEAMQSALGIYFDIAKDTNIVLARLTGKILVIAHRVSGVTEYYMDEFMNNADETMMELIEDMKKKYTGMFCFFIERCLVLAGEIAMRTVIHVDVTWFREVKKLPEIVGMVRRGELTASKTPNRLLTDWEFRAAMHRGLFNYSTRDEANPHGNTDDDRVRAMADNILNRKLFRDGKLLARLAPFVMYALRAESSPPSIRDAAAVAFSKFMLVSREFSERGAPLFFMILNNSMNPIVRHNFIVASGDLCSRMPNLVEKYSNNVYAMTKDPEPMVRETAILVLTHLLTNHMLKHKGCLADVAKLITDRVSEISTLTKEFFAELGNRGIVYNLLPDFISRLSRSSREVSLQQFKIIMSFLLQQIKDRQMDVLVEKMCARFAYVKTDQATSKNSRIAHYYSFCISQINLSDRAFVKMRDHLNDFASFMEDQQVYEDFKAPLEKLIKTAKNVDTQLEVPEFLQQLTAIHNRGLTGDEFVQPRPTRTRGGGRGRGRGGGGGTSTVQRTAARRRRVVDSDSDELDDLES